VLAPDIRALDQLRDLVYVAGDREQMIALIADALDEDSGELAERRIRLARRNTWADRTAAISGGIIAAEREEG
jgi:hypothetical protein